MTNIKKKRHKPHQKIKTISCFYLRNQLIEPKYKTIPWKIIVKKNIKTMIIPHQYHHKYCIYNNL